MFGLFSKKSEKEKLQEEHKKTLEQAFKLAKTDRKASDAMYAKADILEKKIAAIKK